jgi:hypothetical protein
MILTIILISAILLSLIFHFVGVYADAKKSVWVAIILFWAAATNIAMSEVKPNGYGEIEKMKGQNSETDLLIKEALPKISIYELIEIKQSFQEHKKQ